jgi:hypothetical protein
VVCANFLYYILGIACFFSSKYLCSRENYIIKMKKSTIVSMACAAVAVCSPLAADAQIVAADSVMQHAKGSRLSVGGYGEVAYSRNFYSDSGNRYSSAKLHKNDPSSHWQQPSCY